MKKPARRREEEKRIRVGKRSCKKEGRKGRYLLRRGLLLATANLLCVGRACQLALEG